MALSITLFKGNIVGSIDFKAGLAWSRVGLCIPIDGLKELIRKRRHGLVINDEYQSNESAFEFEGVGPTVNSSTENPLASNVILSKC
jgi:hypothetical protein